MLDIEIESKRGILFVRLSGNLERTSVDKLNREVINLLKQVGIKNIVFNLKELQTIDKYGINALLNSLKICENNHGKSFICLSDTDNLFSSFRGLIKRFSLISDELAAVHLINS